MMLLYIIDEVQYINKLTSSIVVPCWTCFLELKFQTTTSTYTTENFFLVSKLSINYGFLESMCSHHMIALNIPEKQSTASPTIRLQGYRTKGWERWIYYCQSKRIRLCLGFHKCIVKTYSGYSSVHCSFLTTPIAIRYISVARLICGLDITVSSHQ